MSFSGLHPSLEDVASHYADVAAALEAYFDFASVSDDPRFFGPSPQEMERELGLRLVEHDRGATFLLLSAVEAALRMDDLLRCHRRLKDPLSRAFRILFREKRSRASLEEDLLDGWKSHTSVPTATVSDLKGAFRYRHWLAHGRYWTLKAGRDYDFPSIYRIARMVFERFPLETAA